MRKGIRRKVLAALAAAALLGGLGAFAACGETGAASSGGSDGTSGAPDSQSAGEYAVEFVARGLIVATERCASPDDLPDVPVPELPGYAGEWGAPAIDGDRIRVEAVYTPVEYTVTFVADGEVVAERTYTVEDREIDLPEVPEKAGYTGSWAHFELTTGDRTVEAVYAVAMRRLSLDADKGASDLSGAGFCDVGAAAEVSCSVFAGYDFLGWYEGETLVSGERTFSYTMPDREVTLEARTRVSEEMRNFRFTSSAAGCTISGVVDATVKEISVPAYASVKDGAFAGCDSLESLTLPSMESEDFLGRYFGAENYVLNEEDIPQSLKSVEITGGEEIAEYAFYVCRSLERIAVAESVKKISEAAFVRCTALKEVVLPKTLEEIGGRLFAGCTSLTEINLPAGVTEYPRGVFSECSSLRKIALPNGTKGIGERMFYGCSSLAEVTIPESVETIGADAFNGCASLKKIEIPEGVTEIGHDAFWDCSAMTRLTLPDACTDIGVNVFSGCSSLEFLSMPELCQKLANYFGGNAEDIPETLTALKIRGGDQIVSGALEGCSSLVSLTLPSLKIGDYLGRYFGATNNSQNGEYVPKSLKELTVLGAGTAGIGSVGLAACKGCGSLEKVTLGEGIEILFGSSFEECTSLREIILPDSLTKIYTFVFYNCTALETIDLPDGVTTIGGYAFSGCSSLEELEFPAELTTIQSHAFENCSALENVVLPDGVTEIAEYVFSGCSSLESITLPETLTRLGTSAFEGCSSLAELTIPDACTAIGVKTFSGCSALKSIVLPDGVTSIGSSAFSNCISLKNAVLGNSLETLGNGAFEGCVLLEEIALPGPLTKIGDKAFANCANLSSVTLGGGIQEIGSSAFFGCAALKSIAIPESVEKIGLYAFRGTSLESAAIQGEGSWQYFDSDGGTPEVSGDIPAEELSDPAAAAKALSQTYAGFYLLRKTASPDV